ncbi:hypothetical protein QMO14_16815 [Variovorax sp. CAN2819]|uniref:hypothetical protein n=1 Tax=Variovorax sp. CAN15 TaxID=3046727 RepID=UPI002647FB1D|nr:hypothetical protein [Variovorax sp. CAN15]MDN6885269.1 hypothetical protein [Variovorax sp. CAN15]
MAQLQPFTGQLDPSPAPAAPALQPFTGQLDAATPAAPTVNPVAGFVAGLGRGAKDVIDTGAQLLASGFDKVAGTKEGERVAAMNKVGTDQFKQEFGGSTAADVGRVGGQVLATLPVGGAVGAGVRALGAAGGVAPSVLVPLGEAITSGGLSAQGAGLGIRSAGGAISGGLSAGLADPEQAGTGAFVGAALPGVVRGLGVAGQAIGRTLRGPEVPLGVRQAGQAALDAGFTLPPSQVNPTVLNQALEGVGGKIKTAQQASIRNQDDVNELVRRELKLGPGEQLTPDLLNGIRQRAGAAYDAVGSTGTITPTAAYTRALDNITAPYRRAAQGFPDAAPNPVIAQIDALRSGQFEARSAIDKIRELREMADAAYRRGEKDAGRAFKSGATALENAIEQHLATNGFPLAMLDDFRNARQTIAKTYTIERALNPTTGSVSASNLAAQLARGKPLSGNLETIARAAQAFPKAFQDPAKIGSVTAFSPLDVASTVLAGAAGAGLASLGLPVARMGARAAALSGPIQRALAAAPAASTQPALGVTAARLAIGRGAPVALSNRDQ